MPMEVRLYFHLQELKLYFDLPHKLILKDFFDLMVNQFLRDPSPSDSM